MENQKPALDGMFATIMKYGKTEDVNEYVNKSGQFRTVFASLSKKQVALYKKLNDNFVCSLSVLYARGIISKLKYGLARSALVMENNGKKTKRGYLSKERIKLGNEVQIPKLLPYNSVIKKVNELDIGEVYNLSETICSDLPENEKVNGVYIGIWNSYF